MKYGDRIQNIKSSYSSDLLNLIKDGDFKYINKLPAPKFNIGDKVVFDSIEGEWIVAQVEYFNYGIDGWEYHLAGWANPFKESDLMSWDEFNLKYIE